MEWERRVNHRISYLFLEKVKWGKRKGVMKIRREKKMKKEAWVPSDRFGFGNVVLYLIWLFLLVMFKDLRFNLLLIGPIHVS